MMIFFSASGMSVLNSIFFHVEIENEDIKYYDSEYKSNREAHNVTEIIEVGRPSAFRGWWLFIKSKFEKKTMEAAFAQIKVKYEQKEETRMSIRRVSMKSFKHR